MYCMCSTSYLLPYCGMYVYKAQAYSLLWCDWCSQDLETPAGKKLEAVWRWWMTRAACERDRGWLFFSHCLSALPLTVHSYA